MLKSMLVGFLVAVFAFVLVPAVGEAQGPGSLSSEERSAFESLERRAARVLLEGGTPVDLSAEGWGSLAEAFEVLADEFDRAFSAHRQAEEPRDAVDRIVHGTGDVEDNDSNMRNSEAVRVEEAFGRYAMMLLGTRAGADAFTASVVKMRSVTPSSGGARILLGYRSCLMDECSGFPYGMCRDLERSCKARADEHSRASAVHIRLNRDAMRAIVGAVSTMLRGRTSGMESDRVTILREAVNDGRGMLAGDFDEDSFDSVLRVLASDGAEVARQAARRIRTRILRPAPAPVPAPTTTEAGGAEGGGRRADAEGGNAEGRGAEGRGAGGSAAGAGGAVEEVEEVSLTELWTRGMEERLREAVAEVARLEEATCGIWMGTTARMKVINARSVLNGLVPGSGGRRLVIDTRTVNYRRLDEQLRDLSERIDSRIRTLDPVCRPR